MWKNSTIIKLENFCIELRKSITKKLKSILSHFTMSEYFHATDKKNK